MIRKILIPNRGEIAVRIARTCRRLGIDTVAVFTPPDRRSLHAEVCDEAVALPEIRSYLDIEAILGAVETSGADAIHPGFGFLAENADFAEACRRNGILFLGPSPEAIARLGDKSTAKLIARRAGVQGVPGTTEADLDDDALIHAAAGIGFPLMVKAAAGGGGRGMRRVENGDALPEALASARREAEQTFGSDALLLERALENPRHIEIQILADRHGHTVHLGERECSIQRRHQKILEEAPSPAVDPQLRETLGAAAVALARAVDYTSAGTVEFLLDAERFYFLEMNTRIQVEHPVTEEVYGLDLVEMQIRIAEGEVAPWGADPPQIHGHALEARIYAEDPGSGFQPSSGPIHLWQVPHSPGVRVDSGIRSGDHVSPHYDSMLAKIIATGDSRAAALRRLHKALADTRLLGPRHNLELLTALSEHPELVSGATDTGFLDRHPELLAAGCPETQAIEEAAAVVALLRHREWQRRAHDQGHGGPWRNNGRPTWRLELEDPDLTARCEAVDRSSVAVEIGDGETARRLSAQLENDPSEPTEGNLRITLDGIRRSVGWGARRRHLVDSPSGSHPEAGGKNVGRIRKTPSRSGRFPSGRGSGRGSGGPGRSRRRDRGRTAVDEARGDEDGTHGPQRRRRQGGGDPLPAGRHRRGRRSAAGDRLDLSPVRTFGGELGQDLEKTLDFGGRVGHPQAEPQRGQRLLRGHARRDHRSARLGTTGVAGRPGRDGHPPFVEPLHQPVSRMTHQRDVGGVRQTGAVRAVDPHPLHSPEAGFQLTAQTLEENLATTQLGLGQPTGLSHSDDRRHVLRPGP